MAVEVQQGLLSSLPSATMLAACHFLAVVTVVVGLVTGLSDVPPELDLFLSKHPISTVTRDSHAGNPTPAINSFLQSNAAPFRRSRDRCPVGCSESGYNPGNWTVYHSVDRLTWCNQTMLLGFSLSNSLADPATHKSIRSCTADGEPRV